MEKISSYHVGVAAEALVAGLFARNGYDVSVQYGANQPEYDLIVSSGDKILKISVKGSQDGGWGLTQNHKKDCTYHEAIDKWLDKHNKKTVMCLVQFLDVDMDAMPRIYLATPLEVAECMKKSANGRGDTVLMEYKKWTDRAFGAGTEDVVPHSWKFSRERIEDLFLTIV